MQNAGIRLLELNWCYLAFDVHPDELSQAIHGAKAMRYIGLNLTVPHKLLAMNLVDEISEEARPWGAVNTIVFEGLTEEGVWQPMARFQEQEPAAIRSVGHNTDADAIVRSVQEDLGIRVTGRKVMLAGAGGAGKAAATRIAREKPSALFLINRTREKADELARDLRQVHPELPVFTECPDASVDLVINATSLGLRPDDGLPLSEEWMREHPPECVYDMIYRPAETLLLKTASTLGCRVANGLGMLLHQGADALELWSGRKAPRDAMREALRRNIYG